MLKNKKKYNILVIEDNLGDFTLVEDYLQEEFSAPEITNAKNFTHAKLLLNIEHIIYDVVLLDLSLPDKDGKTLIEEILSFGLECPIIVLTGYTDIDFSIKSLALGIMDYLLKDEITSSSLSKSILYSIERKNAYLELERSEKRYSNLFYLSPQPMWVYDSETLKIIQVNSSAILHYGFSEEEFLNMTIMDIRPEEDRAKVREVINANRAENDRAYKGTFRHFKKSGELMDVEVQSGPIQLGDKTFRMVIAYDVTERMLFENKITKAIIKSQEDERYEIGGELHDNVCQILAATQITLGALKKFSSEANLEYFNQCQEYLSLASKEIRGLSHQLAPVFFDDKSIRETFNMLLTNFNTDNKYKIAQNYSPALDEHSLSKEIQLNLYRILQEQLRNIAKHSFANNIEVSIQIEDAIIQLKIIDDGIGFNVNSARSGIGLANMKRRVELFSGKINIESSYNNGCAVKIEIPFKNLQKDNKTQ
jgi:PAS domain S-box-containing protein